MTNALPDHARVVVIGCSTAYHLAQQGEPDVVLLERGELTCGTTWHSAAQVRQLRSTRNLTELIRYSAQLYATLEAETGQATGWSRTGSLSIAATPDRLTHIRRQAALARAFGVEAEEVGAAEAARLWPLMNAADVIGAVYSPSDGRVNPSDLCQALGKGAKARGARIVEHCPVTGVERDGSRVTAVLTDRGRIACDAVVLAAGLWSRQLAQLAGVTCPLYACEHFYLLTHIIAGIEGHLPTLSDHDAHLYIRDDVGGLLVGCFEPMGKPLPLDRLPPDFSFDLLNEDWDHFEPMLLGAIHRIPALESAEARMLLNGPESFTPDGAALLGPSAEVDNLFLGCGMNSVGVASGGGIGLALAQWLLQGAPERDLWPVDARRMAAAYDDEAVLHARAPEVLGLHYAISFPGREHATARDLRPGPLNGRLAARGARFSERSGWERPAWFAQVGTPPGVSIDETLTFGRPGWFDAVAAEHRRVREAVGIVDQSTFGKLRVEGPDAEALLQRLCANDMAVAPGRIIYSAMLGPRGGFEADLTALRLADDRYLLVCGTATLRRDLQWLRSHLDGARATIADVTGDWAVLGVTGPRARDLLARLTDADLSNAGFPFYRWRDLTLASEAVRAARLSYAGELGWELHVAWASAGALYDALLAAGADLGVGDCGILALSGLRIEKGFRAWGHDITPDDSPHQAGLAFAVRPERKGDFIGRTAFLRGRDRPLDRRLIFLTLDDPTAYPIGGEPILQHGRVVGQATSAAFGHSLGRAVAMGYVALEDGDVAATLAQGGYALDIAGKSWAVTVSAAPPYDPQGLRMRG